MTFVGSSLELALRSIAAGTLVWALAILAVAVAARIRAQAPANVLLRGVAAAVVGAWLLTVAFYVLIALHAFRLWVALLVFTAAAGTVWRAGQGRLPWRLVLRWWSTRPWRRSWFPIGAAVVGILAARALFVPPVSWDTLTYHLVKAALWVQSGGPIALRAPGGGGLYVHVPANVDLLWAWAMLPFHSDFLVGVADVATLLLFSAAVYTLGRELGARPRLAALGAAFVAAMPSVLMASGSNYVDNMVAFYLTAATTFALRHLRRGEAPWAVLAAMAAGLAAGSKLTAVSLLAVFLAAIVLRTWRGDGRTAALRVGTLALVLALSTGAPGYLRAWLETGHPFSPYSVRVAGIVLGDSPDADWYNQRKPPVEPYTLAAEWPALCSMFHDPFSNTLGPFAALPLLILPASLAWLWRRHRGQALLVGMLIAAAVQTYVSPQYAVVRLGWARMGGRYFLHPIALAVALALAAFPGGPLATVLVVAAVLSVWFHGALYWTGLELTLVGCYLAVLAVAAWLAGRFSGRARILASAALALVCLGLGQAGRQLFRYDLAANATVMHEAMRFPTDVLTTLDGPTARTVAFTSGPHQQADNWFVYPFLGSHLQNTPVYVPISRSGRLVPHPDPAYLTDTDVDACLTRLQAQRVDAVVSFSPAGPELAWMEARPAAFIRLSGDGQDWGVYELTPRLRRK
jgi:hypothetical protein